MAKELTPKQEKFCQVYIETGNATEAYRQAYPRSLKWKENSVYRKAFDSLGNAKVDAVFFPLQTSGIRLPICLGCITCLYIYLAEFFLFWCQFFSHNIIISFCYAFSQKFFDLYIHFELPNFHLLLEHFLHGIIIPLR